MKREIDHEKNNESNSLRTLSLSTTLMLPLIEMMHPVAPIAGIKKEEK